MKFLPFLCYIILRGRLATVANLFTLFFYPTNRNKTMSDNTNIENNTITDNTGSWVDANLVFCIKDSLATSGIHKTREAIRRMAYDLSDELVELLWNSVPIAARAELVNRAYARLTAIGEVPEELDSSYMLRAAAERVIASASPMLLPSRFKNAVYKKALDAPVRFIAEHHENFVDPVRSYTTASKYTELKDRKVLTLAHILGVLA